MPITSPITIVENLLKLDFNFIDFSNFSKFTGLSATEGALTNLDLRFFSFVKINSSSSL